MNTFTVTFKTEQGLTANIEINVRLFSVLQVKEWFEDSIGKRAISITKH